MKTIEHKRQIPCRHCGNTFRSEFGARYCSDGCRRRRHLDDGNAAKRKANAMTIERHCEHCKNPFS